MGTTKTSGWALFWFLAGFMLLPTAAVGAPIGSVIGAGLLALSVYLFKVARVKEGV